MYKQPKRAWLLECGSHSLDENRKLFSLKIGLLWETLAVRREAIL